MNKRLGLVFQLAIFFLLILAGCRSTSQDEFVPLDYTEADVIQNEISTITKLLETESVQALWRASLLQRNSFVDHEAIAQVLELCGQKVVQQYHAALDSHNHLEARRLLWSLEAVDYPLDEVPQNQHQQLLLRLFYRL